MTRHFYTIDVFTLRILAGNPLAVVLNAQGLDDQRMQAIVGEFNLSETAFVAAPVQSRNRESLRIFTPAREVPFARAYDEGTDAFTNAFVYCAEPVDPANAFHARMFDPSVGVPEDPATGPAGAAFAGVFMDFERPADGQHSFIIEQGGTMGWPSRITVSVDVAGGRLNRARVGGEAVIVSDGRLRA